MNFNCRPKWITMSGNAVPAPIFRKDFTITGNMEKAICKISGLGAYVLTVDGKRIDDTILNPRFSNYDKTVYYNEFNLNGLSAGTHTLGVCLGRSRHSMLTENTWGWHKPPWDTVRKFILQIDIYPEKGDSQCIISDESWYCLSGPIRYDCLYAGEVYDANYESVGWDIPGYNAKGWGKAVISDPPKGKLELQTSPPIKQIRIILPEFVQTTKADSALYAFNENTAGNIRIEARGQKGASMKMRYGEKINSDMTVNSEYTGITGEIQTDTYIFSSDKPITYEPVFSYKGFRYVEVVCNGEIEIISVTGIVYHNDVAETGTFLCSSDLINSIHGNSRRAFLSNLHHLVTDTPIYEKNGWTGDAQLTSVMAMYNFNINSLYETWLRDFADSQMGNGEIPPIIPSPGWGYTSSDFGWEAAKYALPAWDAAYFEIAWHLYRFYNNRKVIEQNYHNMAKYLEYLGSCSEKFIITTGLGDWLAPVGEDKKSARLQPEENHLSSTAYYFRMAGLFANFAGIMGKKKDEAEYRALCLNIKNAFNSRFLDKSKQIYRLSDNLPYRQTPNILPLAFNMTPDGMAAGIARNLNDDIINGRNGHLWCGILGTRYIFDVLCRYGYIDTAYGIISKTTYPSWGYWIKNGATALYEDWELDTRSRNHHMFGSVDSWFFSHLSGIQTDGPGFDKVIVKPYFPTGLNHVKSTFKTAKGVIAVLWERISDNEIRMCLELPTDTKGVFINTQSPGHDIPLGQGMTEFTISV